VEFNWQAFLEQYSQSLLDDYEIRAQQTRETLDARWLGFAGAATEEITAVENRLGIELPPSYRQFLQTSNGWRNSGKFIYRIWSTTEIVWFKDRHQDWIDAYAHPSKNLATISEKEYLVYGNKQDPITFRVEYLQTALEISDVGDAAIYLLNPQVVTKQGEWEAWFFANWLPGATRYRSFRELMEAEYQTFLALSE
jgi:hypothetical protein